MGFNTFAHALAQTGLVTTEQARRRGREIAAQEALAAREARRVAWERGEKRRQARREEARDRRVAAVAAQAAEDRAQFEARESLDADEIVKVEGVWVWRTGRHAGKTVGAKALAKRGIAPRR